MDVNDLKGKYMRILVACEESQAVTIELRKLGHEAYIQLLYQYKVCREQRNM